MNKTIVIFVLAALVLLTVLFWVFSDGFQWNLDEILMIGGVVIVYGFAILVAFRRVKSLAMREPAEDELSRALMTRSSSLSYYISIYLWLVIMYFSDKTSLAPDALIGLGILGMAMVFFLSWVGVKFFSR
jgi:hypothetical protein